MSASAAQTLGHSPLHTELFCSGAWGYNFPSGRTRLGLVSLGRPVSPVTTRLALNHPHTLNHSVIGDMGLRALNHCALNHPML